jgi:hypothetical protein
MDLHTGGPLITLKEAGKLLAMDLNSILRIANKKAGARLRTIKVSPRVRRTTVAWVEAYLRELNPPIGEVPLLRAGISARKAAMIDRELAARGYGRGRSGPRKSGPSLSLG